MTDKTTSADIVTFRKRPLTGAERQARYKANLKKRASAAPPPPTIIAPPPPRPRSLASIALRISAVGLGACGLAMNAYFARSLGSTDFSAWLFLALGVASDAAALALPSVAARLWQEGERGSALAGWLVWATVFAFALLSGLGFASASISDVTLARSERVTPQVTAAQTALTDAMTARDRECHGGVGKFCRQREDAVTEARHDLEAAMAAVTATGDPQTVALVRLVTWVSRGYAIPSADDVGMVRLLLLSFLPQVGGVLLMVSRR